MRFAAATEVVDKELYEQGIAAVGRVKWCDSVSAFVEWPDGSEEHVPVDELQEA